jgi:hypothetical protein
MTVEKKEILRIAPSYFDTALYANHITWIEKENFLSRIYVPKRLKDITYNEGVEKVYIADIEAVTGKQNLAPTLYNYIAAYISSLIGPLPTYAAIIEREQQAFYGVGLGLRVLLSGYFFYGFFIYLEKGNQF